jgi:cation-transporting P-type ATPase D
MHLLQPIFANPAICKVFHGADSDILWLQRDFHIYIANLFDTARVSLFFLEYAHSQAMSSPWHSTVNHFAFVSRPGLFADCLIGKSEWVCLHLQACDVLGKPQRSLAYLLQTYCGIAVNKVYQRADWRLRPLSTEMEQYARTDAHYLLYIAHCLRAELLQPCKPSFVTQDLLLYHPREHIVYCVCMCFQFSISVSMENMGRFRRMRLCCCRWKTGEWRYLEAQGPHDRGCAPLQSIVPATL